jgi:hypothetical protein
MRRFCCAALLVLMTAGLLAAAPPARAEGAALAGAGFVMERPAGWVAAWLVRVAGWLGWGERGAPEAVFAPAAGDCSGAIDPNGSCRPPEPEPASEGDCGGLIIPDGARCN